MHLTFFSERNKDKTNSISLAKTLTMQSALPLTQRNSEASSRGRPYMFMQFPIEINDYDDDDDDDDDDDGTFPPLTM